MAQFKNIISNHIAEFEDYFVNTDNIIVVVIDKNLKISEHNRCFSRIISSGKDLTGKSIKSLLLSESQKILPLPEAIHKKSLILNFHYVDSSPIPLNCYIVRIENDKHLIIGGHIMLTSEKIIEEMTVMSNEMANMTRELHKKNQALQEAQSKIKTLSGIVPICMHCKGIRNDKGYWDKLETYISEHSDLELSHGICDDCLKKYYPNLAKEDSD